MDATNAVHPMDRITVRPLRFDVASPDTVVWSQSKPEFAIFANALGIHVPYFERYLVAVMRSVREDIGDPKLAADVRGIIGQEANHAHAFANWTTRLAQRYPAVTALDQSARRHFEHLAATASRRYKVGFVAGYETFTFLAGLIILDRYDELMGQADPTLRAMWVWHQVEEVEHGSVAFDVYQALYGDQEWYRRAMVAWAAIHIVCQTFLAYAPMVAKEYGFRRPVRMLAAWRFFGSFAWDLLVSALPVLRRGYRPRLHPRCNGAQNAIAVGWRAWSDAGAPANRLEAATVAAWTVNEGEKS